MLYNQGTIFLYLSFFVNYILSLFGKALNYSSLKSRCRVIWCSYARGQRIWQSPFVIINPQTGNGAGVWMTSCPEEMVLRIWGFWKEGVGFWQLRMWVGFWSLKHVVGFFGSLPTEILNITRCILASKGSHLFSCVMIAFPIDIWLQLSAFNSQFLIYFWSNLKNIYMAGKKIR